jgi:putative ABC transport system permease protein
MLNQIVSLTAMNLKSLRERIGLSLVIVVGLAGVVGVLTALLAMSKGFEETVKATGRADRALVLRGGSSAELNSGLGPDSVQAIRDTPGAKIGSDGKPLVSAELIVIAELPSKARGGAFNVTLRGVEPAGIEMRPEIKIVEGRMFKSGLQEVIVGAGALKSFEGIGLGGSLRLRGSDWTIVGAFSSGDSKESEILTDFATAQTAFRRTGASSVLVQLDSNDAVAAFEKALKADPRVNVDVEDEQSYFSKQTEQFGRTIGGLALVVSIIMGLGALFAALNTMFAAVAARTRQIATLRAIGFGGIPVAGAVLIEAMLLALLGGILGAVIAYVLFNNFSVSTLGQGFTQVVFNFRVTPDLVGTGVLISLAIGFVGGLLPAIRAARLPVTTALRAG